MNRFARLAAMFDGPPPTTRREQGMKDARAGKPPLSRDPDYRTGYALGVPEREQPTVEQAIPMQEAPERDQAATERAAAKRIVDATMELNRAASAAYTLGLRVEMQVNEMGIIGRRHPLPMLDAMISRVLDAPWPQSRTEPIMRAGAPSR